MMAADLTGADLTRAHNLTQAQIDSARIDPESPPDLPPGLTTSPAVMPSAR